MNRRQFLRATGLAAAAIAVPKPLLSAAGRSVASTVLAPPTPASPYLELQGGPFRDTCDGLCDYTHVDLETAAVDMIHHRMPAKWRERLVLKIDT